MYQQAALAVYRGLLTKIIRSIKEPSARRIHRGQQRKPLFDRFPFRQWVNPNVLASEARDIKVFAVLLFDQSPKLSRNFEAPFNVDSRRVVSSQHNFRPDESIGGWPKG